MPYRSQGNISFNETGLCVTKQSNESDKEPINVGLLKTPVHHKVRIGNVRELKENTSPARAELEQLTSLNMNTPMALKDISNRAQRELAMLYSPCIEEEETSPLGETVVKDPHICKQLW